MTASDPTTLTLSRRLTPSQAARRDRVREAARALASEGGYAAVNIRDVARRAGVGPATVYRYFSSKDHLIAEVHAQTSRELIDDLAAHPPAGAARAERVENVFHRMLDAAASDTNLAAAGIAAFTSNDPAASAPGYWREMIMLPYLDAALGSEGAADREELAEILGHLFFSMMIAVTAGRSSLEHAKRVMSRAVQRMLRDD